MGLMDRFKGPMQIKPGGKFDQNVAEKPANTPKEEIKTIWTVKTKDRDGRFYTVGSIVMLRSGGGNLRLFQDPDREYVLARKERQ